MKRSRFHLFWSVLFAVTCLFLYGCGSNLTSSNSASSSNPFPDGYIVLNFVNSTGINANRLHIVVRGNDWNNNFGYYDLSKEPAQFVVTNNVTDIPDTTIDTLIARGNTTIQYLNSGRLYVGIDQRVASETDGWTKSGSTSGIIFDKLELSVVPTGPFANLTQVDFFGIPMKLTYNSTQEGFKDGVTRKQIFDDYVATMDANWDTLLITSSEGTRLRILNPGKIASADASSFGNLTTYWDSITSEYWAPGHTVSIYTDDTPNRTLVGTADGAQVDFGSHGVFKLPTSIQMFGQEITTGSNKNIIKWLSGAINRGVIKRPVTSEQGDDTKFYSNSSAYNGFVYNYYSDFLHNSSRTISGHAYAIAFDDVFGYSSSIPIPNHGGLTLEVQPME